MVKYIFSSQSISKRHEYVVFIFLNGIYFWFLTFFLGVITFPPMNYQKMCDAPMNYQLDQNRAFNY
jgi:hypothetical protein